MGRPTRMAYINSCQPRTVTRGKTNPGVFTMSISDKPGVRGQYLSNVRQQAFSVLKKGLDGHSLAAKPTRLLSQDEGAAVGMYHLSREVADGAKWLEIAKNLPSFEELAKTGRPFEVKDVDSATLAEAIRWTSTYGLRGSFLASHADTSARNMAAMAEVSTALGTATAYSVCGFGELGTEWEPGYYDRAKSGVATEKLDARVVSLVNLEGTFIELTGSNRPLPKDDDIWINDQKMRDIQEKVNAGQKVVVLLTYPKRALPREAVIDWKKVELDYYAVAFTPGQDLSNKGVSAESLGGRAEFVAKYQPGDSALVQGKEAVLGLISEIVHGNELSRDIAQSAAPADAMQVLTARGYDKQGFSLSYGR